MKRYIMNIMILIGLCFHIASAEDQTILFPVADTFANSASVNGLFGTRNEIWVRNWEAGSSMKGYIQFQLPSEKKANVRSVTLSMVRTEPGKVNLQYNLYAIKPASERLWKENGITWNNAPANNLYSGCFFNEEATDVLSVSTLQQGETGELLKFPSTPELLNVINSCLGNTVTFLITQVEDTPSMNRFASKEHETYAPPKLILETVVPGSFKDLAWFRKPVGNIEMAVDGFLWIEAEDFLDYGEWRIDTQFVHKMGSAYLLAAGVGEPLRNAVTEVQISKEGTYRLWVRTKNWFQEYSPGKFAVSVNGQQSKQILGAVASSNWVWESAGEFDLKEGLVRLELNDLTGAFARCDALILTSDLAYNPPEELEAYLHERARLTGIPSEIKDQGEYDVIVVGGGTAGSAAAIAAARMGAKTALVQDRPVLGGNASTELGVYPNGASTHHSNARESGIIEEATLIRFNNNNARISEALHILANAETNLTLFFNQRVIAADMKDASTIRAVEAVDTLTHVISRYRGKYFIDCTGDGWVGYYAGAKCRFGRESREEFNETAAPLQADNITMSGCIIGNMALSYRADDMGEPVNYVPPSWAYKLPPATEFNRTPRAFKIGQWWLEHPGDVNDLDDPEFARDELVRITFGYWGFIKNAWENKDVARNYALAYVPHMNALRETRRLVGDYIMKQQDMEAGTNFPDRISYGGWKLDIHHPRGILSGAGGAYDYAELVPIYSIPFRSTYSTNIANLFFAGRNMSVTHVALGSVRVMSTLATVGQAAGTAAALCAQREITPRELGHQYIDELQQILLKNDQYIPDVVNEDVADLARSAEITASSTQVFSKFATLESMSTSTAHELDRPRAVMFPAGLTRYLGTVGLCMSSECDEPIDVILHVREADESGDFSSTSDITVAKAKVLPGKMSHVTFDLDCRISKPYVWLWIPKTPGVKWFLMEESMPGGCRAYCGNEKWKSDNGQYAFFAEPALSVQSSHRPENIIDGITRNIGGGATEESHQWVSDSEQIMPQWVELDFEKIVQLNKVQLTFDTDINRRMPERPASKKCVKDYYIEIYDGNVWERVMDVKDNFLRHRVHCFPTISGSKLRVVIEATNGDPSARIFEIRTYNDSDGNKGKISS
ncbi:MAG: FAD-dependent oxidoreductase [Kiritimatiellales bacterium]